MKSEPRSAFQRRRRFVHDMLHHTPILKMSSLLFVLWIVFSAALFLAEKGAAGTTITSFGRALYWGIAAFSTAGIADMPVNSVAEFIGALWIVVGSMIFFGAIVAGVTGYFMRPLQRPSKQIVDVIEYNLEQLDNLDFEELELLRRTTDSLIRHVERLHHDISRASVESR